MYPNEIIFGITLYDIFMLIGIVMALVIYDAYVSKRKLPIKVHNFYLVLGVASIITGLIGAGLFQSVFNYIKSGVFKWGGITFYGGIITGAATFLIGLYLVGGRGFKEREHLTYFTHVYEVAPCCITIAHAFGRIGCLTAGCCHGAETDGFPGIFMRVAENPHGAYYVPTQLYEAIFLFCLFALLSYFYKKNKKINFIVYLLSYGSWRFIIEFFRADERGALLPFLTPAQAISVLAIAIGLILLFFRLKKRNAD